MAFSWLRPVVLARRRKSGERLLGNHQHFLEMKRKRQTTYPSSASYPRSQVSGITPWSGRSWDPSWAIYTKKLEAIFSMGMVAFWERRKEILVSLWCRLISLKENRLDSKMCQHRENSNPTGPPPAMRMQSSGRGSSSYEGVVPFKISILRFSLYCVMQGCYLHLLERT